MKTEKGNTKRKALKPFWTQKDRKLFRLNLAIYQADPGEPAGRTTMDWQQRKAS